MPWLFKENNYYSELIQYRKLDDLRLGIAKKVNQQTNRTSLNRDYSLEASMRSRRKLIDYGLNNPWTHFLTLTLDASKINRYDYDIIKKRLSNSLKNYQQRIDPDFKYVISPELHKDGAIHFHGLLYLNQVTDDLVKYNSQQSAVYSRKHKKKVVVFDWLPYSTKFGFTHLVKIYNQAEFVTYYMTKYITKSNDNLTSYRYMNSRGLKRSKEHHLDTLPLVPNVAPSFVNKFVTKYRLDNPKDIEMVKWFIQSGY